MEASKGKKGGREIERGTFLVAFEVLEGMAETEDLSETLQEERLVSTKNKQL
jgi:hypothetical protein